MARPGFLRHKKFSRLARLVGSKALALGSIEMIWEVAYENGDPDVGSAEDLEFAAEWSGEPGKLAAALSESGLVDAVTDRNGGVRYEVHDLYDHAPEYVTERRSKEEERRKVKVCEGCGGEFRSPDRRAKHCSNACRQSAFRNRVTDGNAPVTEAPSQKTDRNAPPAPAPAPAPDQDQISTGTEYSCSEPPKKLAASEPEDDFPVKPLLVLDYADRPLESEAPPEPEKPASPPVAVLPCVGSGPKEFPVSDELVAEWSAAYPGVDVKREVLRAVQWAKDNPTRQKTAKGARKFLGAWLARAQDRGVVGAAVHRQVTAPASQRTEFTGGRRAL